MFTNNSVAAQVSKNAAANLQQPLSGDMQQLSASAEETDTPSDYDVLCAVFF